MRHDLRGAVKPSDVRIILVEHGADLLSSMHPRLRQAALRELRRRKVDVRLRQGIDNYDGKTVTLGDGSTITAGTLMWAAGVRASSVAEATGLEQAHAGRLPVTPSLNLLSHPEVYVIGDMAYLDEAGRPLPQVAPVAIQQAQVAATNIIRQMQGLEPVPFRYRDKGTLAVIGRHAAVAQFGPIRLQGLLAWLMWLAVHIVMLIGFRNRVVVLIDWASSYFSYERAQRLVTRR
jgi:NADH dehydrogenase